MKRAASTGAALFMPEAEGGAWPPSAGACHPVGSMTTSSVPVSGGRLPRPGSV
jgi:hypothetical protein